MSPPPLGILHSYQSFAAKAKGNRKKRRVILVGQYDSPFVRRVAVTLHVYAMPFTRDRTSVFAAEMAERNPLVRIPSLILDGGETLYDSAAILDHLDEQAGTAALIPREGPARRRVLRATVLAAGAIEKAGAVVYERHLHDEKCASREWVARCLSQLEGALGFLEKSVHGPWFFEEGMTQADVTLGCLVAYLHMRLPEAFPAGKFPAVEALAERCEELDAFKETRAAPDEVMPEKGSARRSPSP